MTTAPLGFKICEKCRQDKPLAEFSLYFDYKTKKTMPRQYCKRCKYIYGWEKYYPTAPHNEQLGMEDGIVGGRESDIDSEDNYCVDPPYIEPETEIKFDE